MSGAMVDVSRLLGDMQTWLGGSRPDDDEDESATWDAIEAARVAVGDLVKQSKRAEEFIVYLLTHAPEMPDENGVVMDLRAALSNITGATK